MSHLPLSLFYYPASLELEHVARATFADFDQSDILSRTFGSADRSFGNELVVASANGHYDIVQVLLDRGASVNS